MPRTLSGAVVAQLEGRVMRPVLFFEGEFASGTTRAWSGVGSIEWDGKTWTGVGHLGGVSPIKESQDPVANGMSVSLSGVPTSLISQALGDARQGRPGKIWLGVMAEGVDSPTTTALEIVADPALAFHGRLDVPEIEEAGDSCTITISYENRLVDLERPRERRWTDEDQKIDYPDDDGFAFVNAVQEFNGFWGRG